MSQTQEIAMPSSIYIIQDFSNPWLRPGEFKIKLTGKIGRINYLPPDLIDEFKRMVTDPSSEQDDVARSETIRVLGDDPTRLDWRYFIFRRRIYHPDLGGKKTTVMAITPFDITQMAIRRGRRGHQMIGFFNDSIISLNRPPTRKEWEEEKMLEHVETMGEDPTQDDLKHIRRLYRAGPPLGPMRKRWVTLLWIPTRASQGAQEIRHQITAVGDVLVLGSKVIKREAHKLSEYDRMKTMFTGLEEKEREKDKFVHRVVNVDLVNAAHEIRQLQEQISGTTGIPRFNPPVHSEYPTLRDSQKREKSMHIPNMPDFGKYMPLLTVLLGIGFVLGGLVIYSQTASTPTPKGFDIAALGAVIMVLGMVITWWQSRQTRPALARRSTLIPTPPQPNTLAQQNVRVEEQDRGNQ